MAGVEGTRVRASEVRRLDEWNSLTNTFCPAGRLPVLSVIVLLPVVVVGVPCRSLGKSVNSPIELIIKTLYALPTSSLPSFFLSQFFLSRHPSDTLTSSPKPEKKRESFWTKLFAYIRANFIFLHKYTDHFCNINFYKYFIRDRTRLNISIKITNFINHWNQISILSTLINFTYPKIPLSRFLQITA